MTGSASITSATVMPAICSVNWLWASVPRAAEASSQPSAPNQIASNAASDPQTAIASTPSSISE